MNAATDKSLEHLAGQFGFRSIAPGRDPKIMARGTPGRETSSTAKTLNKIPIFLRVHLFGSLFVRFAGRLTTPDTRTRDFYRVAKKVIRSRASSSVSSIAAKCAPRGISVH